MRSLALVALLIVAGIIGYLTYDFAVSPNETLSAETIIDLPPGTSYGGIIRNLEQKGILVPGFESKIAAKIFNLDKKIKAGEYQLTPPLSSFEILKKLTTGKGIRRDLLIKEGFNRWDIALSWKQMDSHFDQKIWDKVISDPLLLDKMKIPTEIEAAHAAKIELAAGSRSFRSLEGYLFPETYSFQKYDSIESIVMEMLSQFETRARPIMERHEWGRTPMGVYRLLTLASVVEKETGNSDEQPIVASVFWNRLLKKMRLQSDPTTIYALFPTFDGNLKRIHLQTPSAYNTYTLPELPMGPIGNPGEHALRSVVQPAASNFLYFVGRGDGRHVFAETYEAHSKNVRTFQLKK